VHDALDLGKLDTDLHVLDSAIRRYGFGMPAPDPLPNEPFSWLSRSDGAIVISYHNAPVTLLRGKTAEKFAARVSSADAGAAQQLMAHATGNFKRGNERPGDG
jgi:hypothetical protein